MKFVTKGIYMTCGVRSLLDNEEINHIQIGDCLHKHYLNEGDECDYDKNLNEEAIQYQDGRVVSMFKNCGGHEIWIMTDGLHLANDPVYGKEYPYTIFQ